MFDFLFKDAWTPVMQRFKLDQKKKFSIFFYSLLFLALLLDELFIKSYLRFFSYALIVGLSMLINENMFHKIKQIKVWEVLFGVFLMIFAATMVTPIKWYFFPETKSFGVFNGGIFIIGYFITFYGIRKFRTVIPFYAFYGILVALNGLWGTIVGDFAERYLSPISSHMAYSLLYSLGYPVSISGNTITIITQAGETISATVAGACSGIMGVTLFTLMIVGLLIGSKIKYTLRLLIIIIGAFIIFFLNVLRLSLIFILAYYYGEEGFNLGHHWLGSIIFLMFVLTYWLLVDRKFIQNQGEKSGG